MSVLFILIPVSLVFATSFLAVFFWAVRSGQYEDTCTPSLRMLTEDAMPVKPVKPGHRAGGGDAAGGSNINQ